ncbi:MAG: DUF1816 domain-containing protein [Stigonema ocellatum SAG 48.90 = DSM 106950]|nr:DUF1816 domain-containing protein [Stigonema ocellatum SAG 48.90 = DSM 106950]
MIQESLLEFAWWVEIITKESHSTYCTYYFGPFLSDLEAEQAQSGFFEDLVQEGSQEISNQIKWCKPNNLTICEDELIDSFNENGTLNREGATGKSP